MDLDWLNLDLDADSNSHIWIQIFAPVTQTCTRRRAGRVRARPVRFGAQTTTPANKPPNAASSRTDCLVSVSRLREHNNHAPTFQLIDQRRNLVCARRRFHEMQQQPSSPPPQPPLWPILPRGSRFEPLVPCRNQSGCVAQPLGLFGHPRACRPSAAPYKEPTSGRFWGHSSRLGRQDRNWNSASQDCGHNLENTTPETCLKGSAAD